MIDEIRKTILGAENGEELDIKLEHLYRSFFEKVCNESNIRKHLIKILGVSEDVLDNVLMINGSPPLDDDEEMNKDT